MDRDGWKYTDPFKICGEGYIVPKAMADIWYPCGEGEDGSVLVCAVMASSKNTIFPINLTSLILFCLVRFY